MPILTAETPDGKRFQFDWSGSADPTQEEMGQIFDAYSAQASSATPSAQAQAQAKQPEPTAQNWVEAMFPRSSRAVNEDKGWLAQLAGSGLDVASAPGRAYASLGRPEGESYMQAMGRTQANQGQGGLDQFSEGILRDPSTIPLALMPIGAAGAGASKAAKFYQMLKTGAMAGGGMATARQAENLAGGEDLSGTQAAIDMGMGIGGGMLGSGMSSMASGLKPTAIEAFKKIVKVAGPSQKAARELVPQMFDRGLVGPTINSTVGRIGQYGDEVNAAYQKALEGTSGVPVVPLSTYGKWAAAAIEKAKNAGELTAREAADAQNWIIQTASGPKGIGPKGMVDAQTAVNLRSTARKTAKSFTDNPSKEAMVEGAGSLAGFINNKLAQTNPALREADAFSRLYYGISPIEDALEKRATNYGLGLMETTAAAGSPTMAGKALSGMAMKAQRSMATPWALWNAGRLAEQPIAQRLGRGILGASLLGGSELNAATYGNGR